MLIVSYCFATFLLGAIPFAYLLGRRLGHDIRNTGSGNVGATNLARSAGLRWGVVAFLFDACKGYVPVYLSGLLGIDRPWLPVTVGTIAILGHCFSPFLRLRGGKGVATAAGVLLALAPLMFSGLILAWTIALAIFRDAGIASSLAALGCLCVGVVQLVTRDATDGFLGGFLIATGVIVLFRHFGNLSEFFGGEEMESES